MSNVKERILGAVTIMKEEDAEKVWQLIQATFTLANAPEEEPTEEEARIFKAYHDGEPEYQPFMTHEDLMQELGLTTL